jgi:NDP-sugar pyrophosphorylase family protein
VLAGGRGARLRPYTSVLPKPLMPVGDYPILEILLRQLSRAGVTDVTLAVGYMSELLRSFFADGSRLGMNIGYSFEEKPLGTAGPIAAVIDSLGENFIVTNGDLLTTLDFRAMYDHHCRTEADATISLYTREVNIDFGVLGLDEHDQLETYTEKPSYKFDVSMGVNILRAATVRRYLEPDTYLDIPDLMRRLVADGHKVLGYRSDCYWLDIGRFDDYQLATTVFDERRDEFLPPLPGRSG